MSLSLPGCDDKGPSDTEKPGRPSQEASARGASRPPDSVASAVPFSIPAKTAQLPQIVPLLRNVAADSGIEFKYFNDPVPDRYFLPEVMGGGAGWIDYDSDGRLDLYLMNGCALRNRQTGRDDESSRDQHTNRLFRNQRHDAFEDVTFQARAQHGGFGQGCAVGDFNADGFPDLFLANYGSDALLCNNGDGTFDDVSPTAWATTAESSSTAPSQADWSTSAVWFDVDADSDLDLYVVSYMNAMLATNTVCEYNGKPGYCGPGNYEALLDKVYLNSGNGTWVDAAEKLGFAVPNGKGLAIVAVDLDDDLRPEVYVANDMTRNFLFTPTNGEGTGDLSDPRLLYRNVAASAGCAVSHSGLNEASMGVACADFDQDGRPDLFLTHYHQKKNTLYHNLGGLVFDDDSRRSRIAATSFQFLGFGTAAFDYDRNGCSDLFIANGHVLGPKQVPNQMQPQLLRNDGDGRFDDISSYAGPYFLDLWLGRGVARADYDNDGDADLVVTHLDRPVALLRNDTRTGRHFLGLSLNTVSRVPPIGGRAIVTVDGRRLTQPVLAGGSYLSSSDARLLFGLGDSVDPVQLEVFWPSGRVSRFDNIEIDRYWSIWDNDKLEIVEVSE